MVQKGDWQFPSPSRLSPRNPHIGCLWVENIMEDLEAKGATAITTACHDTKCCWYNLVCNVSHEIGYLATGYVWLHFSINNSTLQFEIVNDIWFTFVHDHHTCLLNVHTTCAHTYPYACPKYIIGELCGCWLTRLPFGQDNVPQSKEANEADPSGFDSESQFGFEELQNKETLYVSI